MKKKLAIFGQYHTKTAKMRTTLQLLTVSQSAPAFHWSNTQLWLNIEPQLWLNIESPVKYQTIESATK